MLSFAATGHQQLPLKVPVHERSSLWLCFVTPLEAIVGTDTPHRPSGRLTMKQLVGAWCVF